MKRKTLYNHCILVRNVLYLLRIIKLDLNDIGRYNNGENLNYEKKSRNKQNLNIE